MRNDLLPGDILLYWPKDWLGRAISTAQWDDSNGSYEYCHAGIVLDPSQDQGFEMNPPSSHYTVLSKESGYDVFRPTVQIDVSILKTWCAKNKGTLYPFVKIGQFGIASILARLGLTKASRWFNGLWADEDPHLEVCSATVCAALSMASGYKMNWPRADTNMRPCDIPEGKVIKLS